MKNENESKDELPPSGTPDELAALAAENRELKEAIRLQHARDALARSFKSAGARSPGLMIESAMGRLQFDADGGLTNAAAILSEMQTRFPEQFGHEPVPSIDGGTGTNIPPAITRETLAKMSPAEIAALDWDDVRQALSR